MSDWLTLLRRWWWRPRHWLVTKEAHYALVDTWDERQADKQNKQAERDLLEAVQHVECGQCHRLVPVFDVTWWHGVMGPDGQDPPGPRCHRCFTPGACGGAVPTSRLELPVLDLRWGADLPPDPLPQAVWPHVRARLVLLVICIGAVLLWGWL